MNDYFRSNSCEFHCCVFTDTISATSNQVRLCFNFRHCNSEVEISTLNCDFETFQIDLDNDLEYRICR